VLALHMGLAVGVYIYVEGHGVAADRAVLDVVLASAPGDIHRHNDLFSAGVADIGSFEMSGWSFAAACFLGFFHHLALVA
jgi:hypothetical protein